MEGTLWVVLGRPRYRILKQSTNYYLIDTNIDILTYIIPFIDWFRKQNGIEITKEVADSIQKEYKKEKNSSILPIGITILLSVFIRRFVYLFDINFGKLFNFLTVIFILFVCIILRFLKIRKDKERLNLNFSHYKSIRVVMRPTKVKMFLAPLATYLFTLFMSLLFSLGLGTFEKGNILAFGGCFAMVFLFVFVNAVFFANGDYKVKIYK